jgi:hypothetical protein
VVVLYEGMREVDCPKVEGKGFGGGHSYYILLRQRNIELTARL